MNDTNPKVDAYFNKSKKWASEMRKLREIILDCGLSEELKWGKPCFTHDNNNIAILQGFKESGALMFFKGALLKDLKGILEKPGDNSQAARRFMFTCEEDVIKVENTIKSYVKEAIRVEKQGLQVEFKKAAEFEIPEELKHKFKKDKVYKNAFYALTPGRQRSYLLHFSAAKQSKTRDTRIEKCAEKIYGGKGFNER